MLSPISIQRHTRRCYLQLDVRLALNLRPAASSVMKSEQMDPVYSLGTTHSFPSFYDTFIPKLLPGIENVNFAAALLFLSGMMDCLLLSLGKRIVLQFIFTRWVSKAGPFEHILFRRKVASPIVL